MAALDLNKGLLKMQREAEGEFLKGIKAAVAHKMIVDEAQRRLERELLYHPPILQPKFTTGEMPTSTTRELLKEVMERMRAGSLGDDLPYGLPYRSDPTYNAPKVEKRKYEPAPMPKDEDIDAVLAQIRRSKHGPL